MDFNNIVMFLDWILNKIDLRSRNKPLSDLTVFRPARFVFCVHFQLAFPALSTLTTQQCGQLGRAMRSESKTSPSLAALANCPIESSRFKPALRLVRSTTRTLGFPEAH